MDSDLTKTTIDDYLQGGLDDDRCNSFNIADELLALFENLEFSFGSQSCTSFEIESGILWTRNVLQCVQLLLSHLPFEEHTVYGPVRVFDSHGRRIFNEIYTGNWWRDTQDRIPEGGDCDSTALHIGQNTPHKLFRGEGSIAAIYDAGKY